MSRTHPEQSERVLLLQLVLDLVDGPLQTGDLHTQQGLVLVQPDQLPALLRLQLHLQQLLLLVQELVQVAELGLDALLQVCGVLLSRREMMEQFSQELEHLHEHKDGSIETDADSFADTFISVW